jgi:hypothetical protein
VLIHRGLFYHYRTAYCIQGSLLISLSLVEKL